MKKTSKEKQKLARIPAPSPRDEEEVEERIISSSLPDDAILHILSKLPTKSVLRFRCVCKHWCDNLFKDPILVKAHLNRSIRSHSFTLLIPMHKISTEGKSGNTMLKINLAGWSSPLSLRKVGYIKIIQDPFKSKKRVRFYTSCNGLVLMNNLWSEEDGIMLWNPSTAKIKHIPKPDDQIATGSRIISCNGRDSLYGIEQKLMHAIGALHWIQSPSPSLTKTHTSVSRAIISFDVKHDIFKKVLLAPGLQESLIRDNSTSLILVNLDECLSVIVGDLLPISIWVMKEYGVRESWTKMYSITNRSMTRSMRYLNMVLWDIIRGMLLFLKDDSSLVLYDPKHEIAIDIDIGGFSIKGYHLGCMETYLESFVSLHSGAYMGQNVTISR